MFVDICFVNIKQFKNTRVLFDSTNDVLPLPKSDVMIIISFNRNKYRAMSYLNITLILTIPHCPLCDPRLTYYIVSMAGVT